MPALISPKASKCVTITLEGPRPSSIFNKKETGTNKSKYNPKTQVLYPKLSKHMPPIIRAITAERLLFSPPFIVALLVSKIFKIAIIPAAEANSRDSSFERIIAARAAKAVFKVLTIIFLFINASFFSIISLNI